MARADNHQLTNLTVAQKFLRSFGLLLGLFLFFSASFFGVLLTNWQFSIADAIGWGGMLRNLHGVSPSFFYGLFAAHAISLVLILGLTSALFRKVALPRGGRVALTGITVILAVIDLACWGLLPYAEAAGTALGAVIALESLSLLYLMGRPLHEMWVYARWRNAEQKKVRVVIVGGGFAGLYAALGL